MAVRLRYEVSPSEEEFLWWASQSNWVPLKMVEPELWMHPLEVYSAVVEEGPSYLLESGVDGIANARYSCIGLNPLCRLEADLGEVRVVWTHGQEETIKGAPLDGLRSFLSRFRPSGPTKLPRLAGGLVGYAGHDLVRSIECLPSPPPDPVGFTMSEWILPGLEVLLDHFREEVVLVAHAILPEEADEVALRQIYRQRALEMERMARRLAALHDRVETEAALAKKHDQGSMLPGSRSLNGIRSEVEPELQANMSKEYFCSMVERAKQYILQGEILQVVLSQRWSTPLTVSPLAVYEQLRELNPSPYMFFLDFGRTCLIGSSPEMLVRLEDEQAETRPIAGTRRRSNDAVEDARRIEEMLMDPKERAEHIMLVDLGRNDLGRVCEAGSVKVTEFMTIERYSHVIHMTSHVTGKLESGRDACDLLAASFPAGTLSGAPKVRALEVIDELEPAQRGVYGGIVGWFGFGGGLETAIAIRTIVVRDDIAHLQAGAGIVADSVPEREYEECRAKAGALVQALARAHASSADGGEDHDSDPR